MLDALDLVPVGESAARLDDGAPEKSGRPVPTDVNVVVAEAESVPGFGEALVELGSPSCGDHRSNRLRVDDRLRWVGGGAQGAHHQLG